MRRELRNNEIERECVCMCVCVVKWRDGYLEKGKYGSRRSLIDVARGFRDGQIQVFFLVGFFLFRFFFFFFFFICQICLVQNGVREFSVIIGCVRVCRVRIKKKTACLFRRLSVQLLVVLRAALDGSLLISFSLCYGSIVARPTCLRNKNIKFRHSLSKFV